MSTKKPQEWSVNKKWNPFNSYKLLAQVYRWREIQEGNEIPQPSLITIDPSNLCNHKCTWCNANYILEKNTKHISEKALMKIADFLSEWKGSSKWQKGVEAICIAGGGEPLLNPHVGKFIDKCIENGIEVGVVTNGSLIHKFIEPLSKCTWVGVSVDAGLPETFNELKITNAFNSVIDNMKLLIDYSSKNNTTLAMDRPGYGVSYKYLLHPKNISEISYAARIAKSVGCKNFHMRPVGTPWFEIENFNEKSTYSFTPEILEEFKVQTEKARLLEDEHFGVFGITHKFSNKFTSANSFNSCHAIFMTGVFMPSTDNEEDNFDFGLCCDRRGDDLLLLEKNISDPNLIKESWGSKKHWDIFRKINVSKCPRCTYQPHNQIFEHVIENDSMTYKFI